MITSRLLPHIAAVLCAAIAPLAPIASSAAQSSRAHGDSLPVAARVIPRGAVLTDEDITYIARTASTHLADAAAPDVREGWVARRIVRSGEVLRAPVVSPPIVLTANETVDVVYADGGIMITRQGVVTTDASVGDRVTVRTADGHHLDGVVTGPGRVRIE